MYGVQPFADQLEGFTQPFLQSALQFFVNGAAHLLELFLVGLADLVQLLADGRAQAIHALLIGFDQAVDLLGDALELVFLRRTQLSDRGGEQFCCFGEAAGDFLTQLSAAAGGFFPPTAKLLAYGLGGIGRWFPVHRSHQQDEIDDDQYSDGSQQYFSGHGGVVSGQCNAPVHPLSMLREPRANLRFLPYPHCGTECAVDNRYAR